MPRKDTTTTQETELNDNPARLRLFQCDQDEAGNIVNDVRDVIPDITQQTVLRDAVHLGLPLVRKRLEAMRAAAQKAS